MMPSSLEIQRNSVKSLTQQNVCNAKAIFTKIRSSCERYASILRKIGNISIEYLSGWPRKPKKTPPIENFCRTIISLRLVKLKQSRKKMMTNSRSVSVPYVVSSWTLFTFLFYKKNDHNTPLETFSMTWIIVFQGRFFLNFRTAQTWILSRMYGLF